MTSLKEACDMVDDFISDEMSSRVEETSEFWKILNNDIATAQLYTECLVYKYIALSYGLGNIPLYHTLGQIKSISAPGGSETGGLSPATIPRTSLAPPGKSKRGSGSFDSNSTERKATPKKKLNIARRKSEDGKKSKKELSVENSDSRRKSKNSSKASLSPEAAERKEEIPTDSYSAELNSILLSLTYIAKMCDLSRWDFTKLREVFLTWNKARGWEQTASDYEYAVMKNFSRPPPANFSDADQVKRCVNEVLQSVNQVSDECPVADNRNVGESIKYWEIRHKIFTRPEEAVTVIQCLTLVAKKIFDDCDEAKVLPLLHILCETVLMSPHTPLELLQECYSTFEKFYVWPSYVAQPVKEVLDMIQLEMKCPGHFYRMIFIQDNEVPLSSRLAAKMPSSETHVFIDEDIPDSEALSEVFQKLSKTRASASKATARSGIFRFVLRHVFESVFGSGCCDLSTLDRALQSIPGKAAQSLCNEALEIMEEASMKETHAQAQEFLRSRLEAFSDKLTEYLEVDADKEADGAADKTDSPRTKQLGLRRVSVLYDTCRSRDTAGSITRASSGGQIKSPSSQPGNMSSYLTRSASGGLESPMGGKRLPSRVDMLAQETPADLIGSKVSTVLFNHADLSDTVFELVRNTSKEYVQEKRSSRFSINRKRDSKHLDDPDAFRDSGVIDDEEPADVAARNTVTTAVQHLRIDETEEEEASKLLEDAVRSPLSTTSSSESSSSAHDSEGFWNEFLEKGFDSENDELIGLLKAMSFDQRKSFIMENTMKRRQSATTPDEPAVPAVVPTPLIPPNSLALPAIFSTAEDETGSTQTPEQPNAASAEMSSVPMRKQSSKKEHKKLHRLSRFVRSKKRSTRKGTSDVDSGKLSPSESLLSVSSAPPSTTQEQTSDPQSLRVRTASDPIFQKRRREKWARGTVGPSSSPRVAKSKRDLLSVDVAPRSPFNLSVRSLPGKGRATVIGGDIFGERARENEATAACDTYAATPATPSKASFQLGEEDDDESRRRIDSGIGPESGQDATMRRTASFYVNRQESENHGIGGVEFALKEVQRRSRMSVSDDLDSRTVSKKVLKLVFIGNDKTIGHVARAYYNLRKRQMSRAPLLQHVDLRLFFVPVSSANLLTNTDDCSCEHPPDSCDIRVGELLGSYDSWYHTVVTLSVNNLLRVLPKISVSNKNEAYPSTPEKQGSALKLLAPQEVIASALLSYCRFAVSRTDISMYKVEMQSSTGDIISDVFCCQLRIGHEAYTTAVKAGRFGKLGKLVDLGDDSGPPPVYTRIEYSKCSIDGRRTHTGQMPDTFYHTVCVTPLSLQKNHFRGTDTLKLVLVDEEKRQKAVRRTSSAKLTSLEEVEVAGNVFDIGTLKMEVTRPTQGTFALVLDNSKIYTNIKSVEIAPCSAPEAEYAQHRGGNAFRHPREHQLIKLPLRTFWPVNQ